MKKDYARLFRDYSALVERHLEGFLPATEELSAPVLDAMRYSLTAPGKRVRPVLTLVSAEIAGGKRESVLSAACAVEMIHAASLILDDLPSMDNALTRRGQAALHVHAGEATAVLAADALLMQAFHLLGDSIEDFSLPAREAAALVRDTADSVGAQGMIGGQWKDLHLEEESLESLEFVHSRKTGALFILSATLGARLCRADSRTLACLAAYAKNLGLAYQVVDDILQHEVPPEKLGKDPHPPVERKDFIAVFGIEASRVIARDLLESAVKALDSFGTRAGLLHWLAGYVIERKI